MEGRRRLLALPIVMFAIPFVMPAPAAHAQGRVAAKHGYDISWPQCPSHVPRGGAFGIVGVNDGIAWSQNPCLATEFRWASSRSSPPSLYMNTADPGPQSTHWALGGPKASTCDPANTDPTSAPYAACAYDYGWSTAADALATEAKPVPKAAKRAWWLDVETGNTWDGSSAANAQDIQGSIDYLHAAGVSTVGVYSTAYQWGVIAGGYAFPTPTPEWVAGASNVTQAHANCTSMPFGGAQSPIRLAQYPSGGFDADLTC